MDARLIKQIIYGGFYFVIAAIIAFYLYSAFVLQTEPTSVVSSLAPLSVGNERLVSLPFGTTSLIAKIVNPNLSFGAEEFDYTWELYDASGNHLRSLPGNSFIYPGEVKYVAVSDIGAGLENASSVRLTLGDSKNWNWLPLVSFSKPNIILMRPETDVSGGRMQRTGTLINNEPFAFSKVRIVGIIFDFLGREAAVSETELRDVRAFEERFFSLNFPRQVDLSLIDFSKTQVFAETRIIR